MAVPGDSPTTIQSPQYKRNNIEMLRISRFSVNGTFRIDSPVSKIEVTTLCVGDVGWDILHCFCSALTGSAGDIESRVIAKRAHMIIAGTIISTIVLTRSDEVSESAKPSYRSGAAGCISKPRWRISSPELDLSSICEFLTPGLHPAD